MKLFFFDLTTKEIIDRVSINNRSIVNFIVGKNYEIIAITCTHDAAIYALQADTMIVIPPTAKLSDHLTKNGKNNYQRSLISNG